ncbi:MAG: phosphoribosylglycinamide formyltransferase [Arsenophonus sp.]|nr:MAG: phosphoribosylglycinamide formyltransferase [Arsenophonus sp.]
MKKIFILMSGQGNLLKYILNYFKKNNSKNISISGVFSNKFNVSAIKIAEKEKMPFFFFKENTSYNNDYLNEYLYNLIKLYEPDLIILAGYMKKISSFITKKYFGKIINIHPSLLPKYPGLNTYKRALFNNEKNHGTSIHFVTSKIDAGPIIFQYEIPILSKDNIFSLKNKVKKIEYIYYPLIIDLILKKKIIIENNKVFFEKSIFFFFKNFTIKNNIMINIRNSNKCL